MRQLFSQPPTDDVVVLLLRALGLRGMDDSRELIQRNLDKALVEEAFTYLYPFYRKCFADKYLTAEPSFVRVITVARQVLRTRGRTLIAQEKSICGKKRVVWRLPPKDGDLQKEAGFYCSFD